MTIKLDPSNGKHFCYAPWTNIHINTLGSFKTCCAGTVVLGDLRVNPIDELLSSDILINIKNNILENKPDTNCSICIHQEQHSSASERSWYNDIAENKIIPIQNLFDTYIQNMDIRWSNTCNLSCVYCDHEASSQWAKLKNIPVPRLDYSKTLPGILNFIERNKTSLKNLALLGGEPLLQKENEFLLDVIDANVHINVITNLSVPLSNNKIFNKLLEKNNVMWDISFETIEERFEYVRHGSSWDTIISNIRLLQDSTKDKSGHLIGVTSQYSIYNALNLSKIHQYFSDNDLPMMRWNELHYPNILSVGSLPNRFLELAKEELSKAVDYHYMPRQERFLKDMVNTLNSITNTKNNCEDLFTWHLEQETKYWPNAKYTFADLWSEYRN